MYISLFILFIFQISLSIVTFKIHIIKNKQNERQLTPSLIIRLPFAISIQETTVLDVYSQSVNGTSREALVMQKSTKQWWKDINKSWWSSKTNGPLFLFPFVRVYLWFLLVFFRRSSIILHPLYEVWKYFIWYYFRWSNSQTPGRFFFISIKSSGNELSAQVHHFTYERRGGEDGTFHKGGKVARLSKEVRFHKWSINSLTDCWTYSVNFWCIVYWMCRMPLVAAWNYSFSSTQ